MPTHTSLTQLERTCKDAREKIKREIQRRALWLDFSDFVQKNIRHFKLKINAIEGLGIMN